MNFTFVMRSLFVAALGLGAVSCNNQPRILVPNRVLDRPLDVVLTCVNYDSVARSVTPVSLGQCNQGSSPSCSQDGFQLVGFVANSERNEVAMVRRCDSVASVVDLDSNTPGYQLVPVGQLPSEIDATGRGCRVVTANAGSCDFTVLDGPGLAAIAFGAVEDDDTAAPSSLVSRLVPLRSDGIPLGARPGALLVPPRRLSGAALGVAPTDDGSGDSDGLGVDLDEALSCQVDEDESAWVTFPTCQLLAEVDLVSGQLLQSRRFLQQPDGTVVVEDAGTTPDCPIDCPVQFEDGAPEICDEAAPTPGCRPAVDTNGYFPATLELAQPVPSSDPFRTTADDLIDYSALYVGGTGSDVLVELQFESDGLGEIGRWTEQALTLQLEQPRGIQRIRVTPAVDMQGGETHQFVYAIGGDGATHVVDRNLNDAAALGFECDTQVDPTVSPRPFPACNPLDPANAGQGLASDRRAFAAGPGIRVSGGAGFTDWAFFRSSGPGGDDSPEEQANSGTPFQSAGIVGIGTTSFGRLVVSSFNQLQDGGGAGVVDPAGIMDISSPPHSLWPSVDPLSITEPNSEALPRVDDDVPDRTLPADPGSSQTLAPSLRRIDLAYATSPDPDSLSDARVERARRLGNVTNADSLGRFEGEAVYENEVVRAIVRDYQQWLPVRWNLAWEGNIPGTRSSTGRVECDSPGWQNGTCIRTEDSPSESSRIVDDSASFCDNGVLAGDKVVILGCSSDDDCGLGQRCLTEPTAPASSTGICVSAQSYEDDFEVLRQVCAPFINEGCGRPRREYVVTRAFQTELHIQAIDRPKESHLRVVDPQTGLRPDPSVDLDVIDVQESVDRYTCELPAPEGIVAQPSDGLGCVNDEQCTMLNPTEEDVPFICAADGFCRGPCPGGDPSCLECDVDADCDHFGDGALCVDFQCQRPCESGQRDCVQALLPGPRCFSEFVDYVVRTRNSFTITGDPIPGFITDRVFADPDTSECRENTASSSLLTSRLRLAEDEQSVFSDPIIGIPDCPNADEAGPRDPNPCRITRLRSEASASRYHRMAYEGEPVEAIRFSNPNVSLIIDLADLLTLGSNVDVIDGNGALYETALPTRLREFNRARIPRNYSEGFGATVGYIPISEPAVVGNIVMVFPVQIIRGPSASPFSNGPPDTAYVVDAGGRGGPAGVRGQIIRITASALGTSGGFVDDRFLVR